jgi:hypothetical protein
MSNQSDHLDSDEKISTSLPLEPRKKWFLPKDRSSFVTFIDHGCQLDAEGYPIYPNGSTTFVHDPNICTFRNFGLVGFSKTMSMEKSVMPSGLSNVYTASGSCVATMKAVYGQARLPPGKM